MTNEDKAEFGADRTGWITPPKDTDLKLNPKKVYVNFIIELKELHGKDIFSKDVDVESVLTL